MMKRYWASCMEILAWIDLVCKKYDIKYIMAYGTLLGTVRHKGFIPWDDDMDIGMLRADYNKFVDVVARELPPYLSTTSLLPGAFAPKEMVFNVGNGNRLNTAPEFLEQFHGCPYVAGVDVFVFDRVPEDPDEFAYQDRLIRMLDRMLMLQWEVDDGSISEERLNEYKLIRRTVESELVYTFTDHEPTKTQIIRLLDLACSLCEDSGSSHVENRENALYYGEKNLREDHFSDRLFVPYEGILEVPVPRDYDTMLKNTYGDYSIPVKFGSQHDYPIYHYQRDALYKAYRERKWSIPEEFLEYDENGTLIGNPYGDG